MLCFIVSAIIEVNQNFLHGQTICNVASLFKLLPLIVNLLLQLFHHWLPQTQGFIGISLDHQLGEIAIITSLPLAISYHVGFEIGIGIIFVFLSVFNVIHGQPKMFTLITWIQHALFRFQVTRIFLDNTVGVKRNIFRFTCVIQPFAKPWSVFADLAQVYLISHKYLVVINILFTSFDELGEKTEFNSLSNLKGNVSPSLLLSVPFNIPNTSLIGHDKYRFCKCVLSPWILNVKGPFFSGLM